MLVQPAGVEGVPRIELGNHSQMNKPIILKGFMKGLRCIGRDVAAHLCHSGQFRFTYIVFFKCGKFFQFIGMAGGKENDCFGRYLHGFKFFLLIEGFGII